jgi:hypothetical protein
VLSHLKFLRVLAVAGFALAALPVDSVRAQGNTYHLSPSGDDEDPGTESEPWRTMKRGLQFLQPGDTLLVHEGHYYGGAGYRQPGIPAATASNPIRVLAAPGERPVLHGVLALERPSYWEFDGINITRDPNSKRRTYLLRIKGGVGWSFRNAEIWGNPAISNVTITQGTSGEPRNWTFAGNCVHDIGAGSSSPNNDHNLYLIPGTSSGPGVIERNIFFGVPNGNHIKAGPNSSIPGASKVQIRYNTMWKASQGVLVSYRTHHVSLQRNLIVKRWNGRSDNPGIRGHELTNTTNIAANNVTYGYRSVLLNTQAANGRVRDGGGNRKINPQFDQVGTCSGFAPTNPKAQAYGHLAP